MSAPSQTRQNPRLYSTSQAAHVILGGTDTAAYWGFTFQEFVDNLQAMMVKCIGSPTEAPWRNHVGYLPEDFLELQRVLDAMDHARDPANLFDHASARAFARRCDIVGMHGGVNGIGVGKDTVAEALKPHGFISMAFADTLKASLSIAYGLPLRYLWDRELKDSPLPGCPATVTPRKLMQLWGSEVVRSINPKIWLLRHQLRVASAMLVLKEIADRNPRHISSLNGVRIAIPDVRTELESEYIHDIGGFNAWISRPSLQNASLSNGHSTEVGITKHPTDLYLINEGSLDEFQAGASKAVLSRFVPSAAAAARRPLRP